MQNFGNDSVAVAEWVEEHRPNLSEGKKNDGVPRYSDEAAWRKAARRAKGVIEKGIGLTPAVMGSGTQLDGRVAVLSMETEVGFDPETMEPIRLGEFLSCSQDDPSTRASRNLDWDEFIDSHDYRYGILLKDMAEGRDVLSRSRQWGQKYSQVRVLKERMGATLREHMGPDAVADTVRRPAWFGDLHAERERSACRVH